MKNLELRLAGTIDDSIVDGDGLRFAIFVQGCPRRCPGCQNPETQDFSGGYRTTTAALLAEIEKNPLLTGVTFSGGEPFAQPAPLVELAKACHERCLDVWSYTGYTLEQLQHKHDPDTDALLTELDVLVDGDYREDLRDLTLRFRGSRNQRVIDMQKTRKQRRIVLFFSDGADAQSA